LIIIIGLFHIASKGWIKQYAISLETGKLKTQIENMLTIGCVITLASTDLLGDIIWISISGSGVERAGLLLCC